MELWKALELDPARHRLVTLVGGGGKTTSIYALAHEARALGKTVIITTTTHMMPHPGIFLTDDTQPERLGDLLTRYGIVTVGRLDRADKMTGVGGLETCKALADVVLVEGDGARLHPLKAPAGHEPVLPDHGDAVIDVVGLDCLGGALGTVCHRPELVSALLGKGLEEIIGPADVAALVLSGRGGRKNVRSGIPFCCILNKADSAERRVRGGEIAELLARSWVPAAITCYTEEEQGGLCWF